MDVEVQLEWKSEDLRFCETCGVDPWRLGAFLIFIVLRSEVNGTHEPFTPETLCCQVLHKGKEMTDGQKLLANGQMGLQQCWFGQASPLASVAAVATMASMATMATMAPMAPMAPMATMVLEAVTALLAPKLTIGILQPRLQLARHQEKLVDSEVSDGGQNWWNAS